MIVCIYIHIRLGRGIRSLHAFHHAHTGVDLQHTANLVDFSGCTFFGLTIISDFFLTASTADFLRSAKDFLRPSPPTELCLRFATGTAVPVISNSDKPSGDGAEAALLSHDRGVLECPGVMGHTRSSLVTVWCFLWVAMQR